MRYTFKLIPAIAMLAAFTATSALADTMCYDLCMSCRGEKRAENCNQIESTCNCPYVIDSAKSKNMGVEISKRKLVDAISAACNKVACAREITFENGIYKSIDKGRTKLTKVELLSGTNLAAENARKTLPQVVKSANSSVDSLQRRRSLLPIAPMSMECSNRCNTCANPGNAVAPQQENAQASAATSAQAAQATASAQPAMTAANTPAPADTAAKANAQPAAAQPAADSAATAKAPADSSTQPAAVQAAAPADSLKQDSATVAATGVTPAVDTAALAKARADSIAKADSLFKVGCKLAEATCQCKAHTDNERDLRALDSVIAIRKAYADSITRLSPMLLREEMARSIADSVQAKCHTEGKCKYVVTFTSKELALLEMHPAEEPAKPAPEAAPVKDTVTAKPAAEPAADTAKAEAPAEACPQVATEKAPADTSKKKDRIFYKVTEITYGNFGEHSYYEKDYGRIKNLDDETGYEAGISYLLRWYFYDAGAISVGMGTFYHYKKFNYETPEMPGEKLEIFYHNIGLDIPLSFRLGVPFIPIFKPFISQTFHFHKPIFEVYKFEMPENEDAEQEQDMESTAKDMLGLGFLDGMHTRFNGLSDLTFSVWLGFGLQITRHFSAEYQINFGTGNSGHAHRFDTDDYWRIVVNFAW